MFSRALRRAACVAVLAGGIGAQPVSTEFEVATVKPAAPDAIGRWMRMQTAHEFVAHNQSLLYLMAGAFGVSPKAISGGPLWLDRERYEIVARTPGAVRPSVDRQMAMLRKLLADRFRLSFHREPKMMQCYVLTVAKGGPKLRDSEPVTSPEGPPPLVFVLSPETVRMPGRSTTMAEMVSVLQRAALPHPVLDRTGLTGTFDFDLEFTPDETLFGGVLGHGTAESDKPGLFAALQQQLGLRLEATRAEVDTIVIDRAEPPGEN